VAALRTSANKRSAIGYAVVLCKPTHLAEVMHEVLHWLTPDAGVHIMPRHAWVLLPVIAVALLILHLGPVCSGACDSAHRIKITMRCAQQICPGSCSVRLHCHFPPALPALPTCKRRVVHLNALGEESLVRIGDDVYARIPAPPADVQAAAECDCTVHNHQLLVVRPQEAAVAHDVDIGGESLQLPFLVGCRTAEVKSMHM
jgi:hypothetical protein